MTVSAPQAAWITDAHPMLLGFGGRGSGKSHAMAVWALCRVIGHVGHRLQLTSPTFKKTEILWWRIIHTLPSLDWLRPGREGISRSARELRFINGSVIRFFSADDPASLRGEDNDDAGIDERQEIGQAAVANVLFSLRRRADYRLRQIGTPRVGTDFAEEHDRYRELPHAQVMRFSSFDNPFIPHDVFHHARLSLDERLYRQEVLAEWVPQNALVYWSFTVADNVRPWRSTDKDCTRRFCLDRYRTVSDVIIGVDYPGHAVVYRVRDNDVLHAVDEVAFTANTSASVIGRELVAKGYARSLVFDDASGSYGSTAQSPGRILRQMGFTCHHPKKNPHVEDRVNALSARIKTAAGEIKWFVDPKCRQLIRALEIQTRVKGKPDKSLVGVDDILDAAGYPVVRLFPAGAGAFDALDRVVMAS